ncbi:hypothetical protein [Planomonospora sp. ID82291]|uniref:hypothetical protein n=1 Tax=Planomonospora sp. ID82291 TaxID=2738136 RepID=UPI0018C42DBF|nr:hypothetical protein [Planomonospora sp. ID82291]MBG0819064.1 hypothetical protein [Planomonospora sp. ID82291]
MAEKEIPAWAARLRALRTGQFWSVQDLARELRAAADGPTRAHLPSRDSLARMIRGWESGEHRPSELYATLFSVLYGREAEVLLAPAADPTEQDDALELVDLARLAEASDLGAGMLDDIDVLVDRLCRDYPSAPALRLRDQAKRHLRFVVRLLEGRTTLTQHRELLVRAGWLAALLGCVYYDLGDRGAAETSRRLLLRLGEQAGHGELIGWGWELAAWYALIEGRYRDVVELAEAGLVHAGVSNGAAQLTFQTARGYARLGDGRGADEALQRGLAILGRLPVPDHPEHHFVFDRTKFDFYAATIYTWLGEDAAATEHAGEVVRQCQGAGGRVRWETRLGTTRILLGTIAGRRGELDEAIHYGRGGLAFARRTAGLIGRAAELHDGLVTRYPDEPAVQEYGELIRESRRALPPPDRNVLLP